jgi:hypothetical protein
MPFKLTKDQITERAALAADLRRQGDALAAAIVAFNTAFGPVAELLTGAAAAYNQSLGSARNFAYAIAEEARGEFDDKSERWQEGDKGTEADAWIQQWEDASLDDVDFEPPEPMEEIDPSAHAVTLEDLPDSP